MRTQSKKRTVKRPNSSKSNSAPKKGNKKSSKNKKMKRKYILYIIEFVLLLILIPIGFLYYKLGEISSYDIDETAIATNDFYDKNMDNYTTIALFGVDSRENDLRENTRTDCIIVASINKKTKDVKLASIYRDTFVYINDVGYTKINHAYSHGGPEMALTTLNRNFDLNITDFITINFSALSNIIDALGGVDIKITEDELKYVNAYARDVAKINNTTVEKIPSAGLHTLSGVQATGYCRVRYTSGGDFTRSQRQRTVLNQIVKKATSANPVTLYKIMDEILPQIYTSLDTNELVKLCSGAPFYSVKEDFGFPFEKSTPKINGASVVTAETLSSNVIALHEKLYGTTDYTPSSTVEYRSNEIAGM